MTASSVQKAAPKRKLEISFGGCGFLGVYHVGVGKCVVDHVPHLFDEFSGFYGASAGAITAVCAACKSDPMVPYKWVKKTFEASRENKLLGVLHPSFNLYARSRIWCLRPLLLAKREAEYRFPGIPLTRGGGMHSIRVCTHTALHCASVNTRYKNEGRRSTSKTETGSRTLSVYSMQR